MGNNNFLGLPMFKKLDKLEKVSCAIQLNFKKEDLADLLSNTTQIRNILIQNTKNLMQPLLIQMPSSPYFQIILNNIEDIEQFKINGLIMWSRIVPIINMQRGVELFIDIQDKILSQLNISSVSRIGLALSFVTNNNNIDSTKIVNKTALKKAKSDIKIDAETLNFKISNWIENIKEYNTNIRIEKKDLDNSFVHWDLSLNQDIKRENIKQKCKELAIDIEDKYNINNFLRLYHGKRK